MDACLHALPKRLVDAGLNVWPAFLAQILGLKAPGPGVRLGQAIERTEGAGYQARDRQKFLVSSANDRQS